MGKLLLSIVLVVVFFIIVFTFIFYFSPAGITNGITGETIAEPYGNMKIYFCPRDMCKEKLMELIDSSSDIKCAFYELNLFDVTEKLKEKNADVVIEDSTYKNGSGFHTGFSQALMHNKFCIFDNRTIFTGSMNPTVNDNFLNNNNMVIIESPALAKNYLDEFSELKNDIYGKGNKVKTPVVTIGDTIIENYFCPEDNCKLHIINALKKANSSIYFMTFSFTDHDIGNLVWNKHYMGLDVKGIYDESQLSDFSTYEDMKSFSIIDNNKYKLHHKVFIIDNETVITGSFNPTQNANEFNDENIVIIHDKEIAGKYADEFIKQYNYKIGMPEKTSELILAKVKYDPPGGDVGKEIVEVKNIGEEPLNLEYYYLSDNKTDMRLSGILNPSETKEINPKFSLRNSNGLLFLKHNSDIIDYVAWKGEWEIETAGDTYLSRKDFSSVSESAWEVKV